MGGQTQGAKGMDHREWGTDTGRDRGVYGPDHSDWGQLKREVGMDHADGKQADIFLGFRI